MNLIWWISIHHHIQQFELCVGVSFFIFVFQEKNGKNFAIFFALKIKSIFEFPNSTSSLSSSYKALFIHNNAWLFDCISGIQIWLFSTTSQKKNIYFLLIDWLIITDIFDYHHLCETKNVWLIFICLFVCLFAQKKTK